MIYRKVKVKEIIEKTSNLIELNTTIVDEYNNGNAKFLKIGSQIKAIAYTNITPEIKEGDLLIVELSAVYKKLGTGGYGFVITNLNAEFKDDIPEVGHIVKARYTPLQQMVMSLDEQNSPSHEIIKDKSSIEKMPVIVSDLHSALPAIVCGILKEKSKAKIVYIMPDFASLPIYFSKTVQKLKQYNYIYKTITCGQAYGGDGEAVNIYTALLAAKHIYKADIAIVIQGPGNTGTGTKFGFSGMQCADIFNAIGVLDGKAICALRISNGDKRNRHYGVSHHCITPLVRATHIKVDLPLPIFDGNSIFDSQLRKEFYEKISNDLKYSLENSIKSHNIIKISTKGAYDALNDFPLKLSTMGRGLEEDYSAFIAGYVAGKYATTFI